MSLSLLYLWLASHKSQWCWPAAFISTAIYTAIFWHVSLVSESALNFYYMLMAIFGWWSWRRNLASADDQLTVTRKPIRWHLNAIISCTVLALVIGFFTNNYTHADFAYLDAATTVFAVFATWLLTQRVLENWLYWIVIDIVSIYLYQQKGLMLTSVLMMIYSVFAIYGWWSWKQANDQRQ